MTQNGVTYSRTDTAFYTVKDGKLIFPFTDIIVKKKLPPATVGLDFMNFADFPIDTGLVNNI